jgi:hypothetical protein
MSIEKLKAQALMIQELKAQESMIMPREKVVVVGPCADVVMVAPNVTVRSGADVVVEGASGGNALMGIRGEEASTLTISLTEVLVEDIIPVTPDTDVA